MGIIDIDSKEEMEKHIGKCYKDNEDEVYTKLLDIIEEEDVEEKNKLNYLFKELAIFNIDGHETIEISNSSGPTEFEKEVSEEEFNKAFDETLQKIKESKNR